MLQGSTEKTARDLAIEQLNILAESATLFEIKAAANYLVTNLSARTTKQMLAVFENQISNLLGKAPNHNDTKNCLAAIAHLRDQLPNGPILNAYSISRRDEEQSDFATDHGCDESTSLLFGKKSNKRK